MMGKLMLIIVLIALTARINHIAPITQVVNTLPVSLEFDFDDRVFSLDSIKKAAYRYIDKFSVDISIFEGHIHCKLNFSPKIKPVSAELIADDFKREILDQDLRKTIATETEGVRNLILAHTFSKTTLVSSDG